MSDGEGSDYDVPDLPPMLPELEDLPPIRPLDVPGAGDGQNGDGGDAGATGDGTNGAPADGAAAAAPKPKKPRQPVPRLDAVRLCSAERGIPRLAKDFKTIRFKGKGHEASDIRMLMRRYEHWAHRLFPKYTLRNVTETVELSLASKREVKICLAQLRRGEDGTAPDDDADDILAPQPVQPVPLL